MIIGYFRANSSKILSRAETSAPAQSLQTKSDRKKVTSTYRRRIRLSREAFYEAGCLPKLTPNAILPPTAATGASTTTAITLLTIAMTKTAAGYEPAMVRKTFLGAIDSDGLHPAYIGPWDLMSKRRWNLRYPYPRCFPKTNNSAECIYNL